MKNSPRIMLIDDDSAAHIYHGVMIDNAGLDKSNISEFSSVKEAIESLEENKANPEILPEYIIVDLNMPVHNGWDFIDQFSQIAFSKDPPKIYIVTNSENPQDIKRAESLEQVSGIKTKFLTEEFFRALA